MNIREISYEFVIKNNIKDFSISLNDLIKIIKENGWEIISFRENLSLIEELNLKEKIKTTLGFTYTFKTIVKDNILTKSIIFYDDDLNLNEKYFVILHEIGHIVLNHINSKKILKKSSSRSNLELEADLFACEVLVPSCILKKLNLTNFADINKYTLIPDKYINNYLLEIHKINFICKNELTKKIKKMYSKYIWKYKIEKYKISQFLRLCVITLLILIFFSIGNVLKNKNLSYDEYIIKYLKDNNIEVFVTKTGSKYHMEGCYHLRNSSVISISYEELKNSNYLPCKICFGNTLE